MFFFFLILFLTRFIGELFKVKILKPNVMLRCVDHLIDKHQQESLECLCNLLQTIGNELEQVNNKLKC